jgi:GNAT superfamily N-acetyltransferase
MDARDLVIAPADPAAPEARACVARYFAEIAERFEGGFDPGRALQPEDEALRPPRGVVLLATAEGAPVGCVAVKLGEPGVADLKRLWVAPESRGLGLATRLIAAGEEAARGLGASTIRLDTNRALTDAIALYHRVGYREVPAFNAEPYAHHWFSKAL